MCHRSQESVTDDEWDTIASLAGEETDDSESDGKSIPELQAELNALECDDSAC